MLTGRRVVLRPVEPADLPRILAWQNQPEVAWWMDYERPFSLADIAALEAQAAADGRPFVIELDGRPIGRIGLNQVRQRDRACALYGFIGEPELWNQGLGRDAIMTVLAFAFDELDVHLVDLWTLASNERAVRAYLACGFVVEARLRDRSFKDGAWHDRLILSVTPEEFEVARQAGR